MFGKLRRPTDAPELVFCYPSLVGAEILKQEIVSGVPVVRFTPNAAMKVFAMTAYCDPEMAGKSPEEICRQAGVPLATYKRFLSYEPYWSEWLEERRIQLGGKNKRAMLEAIGMERAMEGDFQFWKPLAQREGVISNDRLDIGAVLPASLGSFNNFTEEQLTGIRDSLLSGLRSVEDQGSIAMVEGPSGWQPEGSAAGAPAVPEEPVALAAGVGADGKRGLEELDAF